MRALALAALAACTPDIAQGAYLCGPDMACPDGQTCNGPDGTCVVASAAQPFACDPSVLHEPDDNPGEAFALPALGCPSAPLEVMGCLADGDPANWVSFQTPADCSDTELALSVTYPIAFESLALQLDEPLIAVDGACKQPPASSGNAARCISMMLAAGQTYQLAILPNGDDCAGDCAYNRYTLQVQLTAP
ncbi:MAG TPA: hypothetical protein VLX92_26655 [Kofleriaceae bacterium]|nr:hypothetical protein [Kofleriaceae bacterium]